MHRSPTSLIAAALLALAGATTAPQATAAGAEYSLPVEAPGSQAILLGSERVRQELAVTSRQATVLDSLRKDFRNQARKLVATPGETAEQKKASLQNLTALTNRFDQRALNALTESQRTRLIEIEAQQLGGYLLFSKAIRDDIGLTNKQKITVAKIHAGAKEYENEVNAWFENGEISGYERLLYLREDREDRSAKLQGLLTSDQSTALKKLMGEPFKA